MEGIENAQIGPSEENAALLLIERLRNPQIKAQLITLYEEAYAARARDAEPIVRPKRDPATGEDLRDTEGAYIMETVLYTPPSREEIERMIDERIEEISTSTSIGYLEENVVPNNEVINLNWKIPWTGKSPTNEQWSTIEGHEKGHNVRQYGQVDISEYFKSLFLNAFDVGSMEFNDEWYEILKKSNPEATREDVEKGFYATLTDPMELTERMSQLKNYFGMKGNEQFTREHLEYARAHYVSDTGYDNLMTPFFQGITPEKERYFLELMNTAGI